MGLLCVNHKADRPSWSSTLITCVVLRLLPGPVEIRSTFNPEVPATLETPDVSILDQPHRRDQHWCTPTDQQARILPGTLGILSSAMATYEYIEHSERTKERSSGFSSSLIGTLRAPCIPACVPRARPQPTYADLSHITSSTHLAR